MIIGVLNGIPITIVDISVLLLLDIVMYMAVALMIILACFEKCAVIHLPRLRAVGGGVYVWRCCGDVTCLYACICFAKCSRTSLNPKPLKPKP